MGVSTRLGRALVRSGRARMPQVEPAEVAQDEVEAGVDEVVDSQAEPERQKRRYRRRDMQAE